MQKYSSWILNYMTSKLNNELRQAILSKIPEETSDTKLAKEFGVSRKTIWRLRGPRSRVTAIPPPPLKVKALPPIEIPPPSAVPELEPTKNQEERLLPPEGENGFVQYPKKDSEVRLSKPNVRMNTYFGVELLRCENFKDVAYEVIKAAELAGILFRKLQFLDLPSIGATTFVRFRTDIENIDPILERLEGRAFISLVDDAFMARFLNGRRGKFSTSSMCSSPRLGGGHTFHGTRIKRWEYQFKAADELPPMKSSL